MDRPPKLEIEKHPHLREFVDFIPEANDESDRGLVVICASYIDELLRRTLLSSSGTTTTKPSIQVRPERLR